MAQTILGGGVTHSLTSEGSDASEDGTGRGTPVVAIPISMQNAGRQTTEPGSRAGDSSGTGIGEDGEASYTITSTVPAVSTLYSTDVLSALPAAGGGKPGTGYPTVHNGTVVRRLTELECERLQGYPDNWTDGQSGSARYRQLGNSVAVPVVTWIAERMVEVDRHL